MFVFTGISLTATLLLLSSQAKESSGSSFLRKHLLGWLCSPLLALTEEGVEKHQQDMSTEWELKASYVFCVCETDSPVFKEPHCQQADIKPTLQLLYVNYSQSQHKSWHLQLWLDIKETEIYGWVSKVSTATPRLYSDFPERIKPLPLEQLERFV